MTTKKTPQAATTLAALACLASAPFSLAGPALAADCLERQRVGLFTERHYSELDRPWRDRANDPKINALATTGLRSERADVVSVDGDKLQAALAQARDNDLPLLAYLDIEASSKTIPMQFGQTSMVTIETALRLQFLNASNGKVIGESSDFGKTTGLDIEQALPDMLQVSAIARMVDEAGREACRTGWAAEPVVAKKPTISGGGNTGGGRDGNAKIVSDIQYVLIDLGFDVGAADGLMGERTRLAITEAQRALREPPNGKPSAGLLAKMRTMLKGMVFEAQSLLVDLDRFDGHPTGVLDPTTELAIQGFELERRLPADGKPDADVLAMLRAEVKGQAFKEPTAHQASDDPTLRLKIETLLFDLGYLKKPPSGQETFDGREAIRDAEMRHGLKADGLPDIDLYRELKAVARGS